MNLSCCLIGTYTYPSMDQLSETLPMVLNHFGVIRMAVGAGANILARFALKHPDMVEGLVLINLSVQAEGFMDWAAQKITSWTHALPDTVISHLFGKEEIQNNHELIATFRQSLIANINQSNLQQFVKSYKSRRNLEIERPVQGGNVNARTLQCPALLIVGDNSPAVDAVVRTPGKLIEAFKYFIQGMGYMPSASMTRLARSRTASNNSCGTNTDEQRGRSHTDVSMESSSGAEHSSSALTHSVELSC
uniref:Protein NDRG1-like n=1 Tax=Sinocyclocheilus rhinocerous TaxID=307959 RepID=A0A673LEY8_9TELE